MLDAPLTPTRSWLFTPPTALPTLLLAIMLLATVTVADGANLAQQQAAPDLNALPDQMPFNVPFGTPITMEKAQALVQAAIAEANNRGWPGNFAVVDWGGNLVAFARMNGVRNSLQSPLPSIKRGVRLDIAGRR